MGDSPHAIAARLANWARHSGQGLARVDYHSELSKSLVLSELGKAGIPVREVFLEDTELANQLAALIASIRAARSPGGGPVLVSIDWWRLRPGITARHEDLAEAARVLNLHRETFAEAGGNQVWWMSPAMRNEVIYAAPDLDSWFVQKLSIEDPRSGAERGFAGLSVTSRRPGGEEVAIRAAKEALALAESRASGASVEGQLDLADAWSSLGEAWQFAGNRSEAGRAFEQSAEIAREAARMPGDPEATRALAGALLRQADFLRKEGSPEQAVAPCEEAPRLRQQLLACSPGSPTARREFGVASNQMGLILQALGEVHRAIEFHAEALRLAREAMDEAPSRFDLRYGAALLHFSLGVALEDAGQSETAKREYEEAIRVTRDLASKDPARLDIRAHLFNTLIRLPSPENLREALAVGEELRRTGGVDPRSSGVIDVLRQKLAKQAAQPT